MENFISFKFLNISMIKKIVMLENPAKKESEVKNDKKKTAKEYGYDTAFKMRRSTALRFRRFGPCGISVEKLILRICQVVENNPEICNQIMDYNYDEMEVR